MENKALEAAKAAFLEIKGPDRWHFVEWCRAENEKTVFGEARASADALKDDLKKDFGVAFEKAKEEMEKAKNELIDAGKNSLKIMQDSGNKLDGIMREFFRDKK